MSIFTDLEKDAASVDGFVSENGLIPTRRNGPKPSYQYLVDGWNAQINAELDRTTGVGRDNAWGTVQDGIDNTVDGDYFSVVSPDDDGYLDLYKNNAGIAEFKKQYPSSEKVIETFDFVNDRIVDIAPVGYVYTVVDELGNAAFGVKDDLTFEAVKFESSENQFLQESLYNGSEYSFVFEDGYGRVALGIAEDGSASMASLDVAELKVDGKLVDLDRDPSNDYLGNYDSNINHVMSYGQSLSIGAKSYAVISDTQKYDSLTFFGGVITSHPDDSANYYSDFKPLIETNPADHEDGYVGGETPCSGTADSIKQLIEEENRINYTQQNYQLLCSAPGEGGLSIAELSKGTTYFTQLEDNITNAFDIAQSKGLTYNVPAVTWTQGEQDNGINTSVTDYKVKLRTLLNDIDSHAKLTCGQTNDVQMICYQVQRQSAGRSNVQTALYEAQQENADIHIATPMYIFDYDDGTHLTAPSSKWMGAYYGKAYKRIIIDKTEWKPLQPISHKKQGKILEVKFSVPRKPLVLDTDRVAAVNNYGFDLFQPDGTTPINITSVTITQPDTVRIISDSVIPSGAILRYAFANGTTDAGSRTEGARGNLRDSEGVHYIFDKEFLKLPMHNWCLVVPEYIL